MIYVDYSVLKKGRGAHAALYADETAPAHHQAITCPAPSPSMGRTHT